MRTIQLLGAASLLAALAGTPAVAAPVILFDGFLTADILVAAPGGATAALAGPGGLIGGSQSDLPVNAPASGIITITVSDIGFTGDVFEVLVDGQPLGTTAPVAVGGPDNSTGTFAVAVGSGQHTISLWDFVLSYAGGSSPFGGAVDDTFSPADVAVTVAFDVPEPASAVLAAGGLLALAARRRMPAKR